MFAAFKRICQDWLPLAHLPSTTISCQLKSVHHSHQLPQWNAVPRPRMMFTATHIHYHLTSLQCRLNSIFPPKLLYHHNRHLNGSIGQTMLPRSQFYPVTRQCRHLETFLFYAHHLRNRSPLFNIAINGLRRIFLSHSVIISLSQFLVIKPSLAIAFRHLTLLTQTWH